jgi:hypothetical protein
VVLEFATFWAIVESQLVWALMPSTAEFITLMDLTDRLWRRAAKKGMPVFRKPRAS